MSGWQKKIVDSLPGAKLDEPLARYTTFRIGGPADCYVELSNAKELKTLMKLADESEQPVMFIGFGSNLLVLDGGVRGIVARLRGDFEKIEFLDADKIRAGAAVRVPQLVIAAAEKGLCGDESLVGIPGTVGGALVMNAGTREGEIGPLVKEVDIFDPQSLSVTKISDAALEFRYRHSNLEGRIVLGCVLQLKRGDKVDIMKRVQGYQQKRFQTSRSIRSTWARLLRILQGGSSRSSSKKPASKELLSGAPGSLPCTLISSRTFPTPRPPTCSNWSGASKTASGRPTASILNWR